MKRAGNAMVGEYVWVESRADIFLTIVVIAPNAVVVV